MIALCLLLLVGGSEAKVRVNSNTHAFTQVSGLCGYEGGRRGPSHPENADPGSARGDMELSTPY